MREQLAKHLKGGEAFKPIDDVLAEIPFDKLGIRPHGLPYSFYELFYHIIFTQKDILDFIVSETYETPNWPEDYWPKSKAPNPGASGEKEWKELVSNYFDDRQQLSDFIADEANELSKPVKNGDKQTLIREILLVMEHTAYHTGQLLVILRLLKLH